jgi:1,4-dihydroxy-2-naphthoyl-CoA hydrolase
LPYTRSIRFQDTDAAGVVYFANLLAICHEAYEDSLIVAGINVRDFFRQGETIVPIVHASVDFFQPLQCGDRILVQLSAVRSSQSKFEITYEIYLENNANQLVSKAITKHICIDTQTRTRKELPESLLNWLQTLCNNDE